MKNKIIHFINLQSPSLQCLHRIFKLRSVGRCGGGHLGSDRFMSSWRLGIPQFGPILCHLINSF